MSPILPRLAPTGSIGWSWNCLEWSNRGHVLGEPVTMGTFRKDALEDKLWALSSEGGTLWSLAGGPDYVSSPILSAGRLYAATVAGVVTAIGDCPV